MKKIVAHIIFIICCTALSKAQESTGAIALNLPARNSLMFNKYVLSPTLSYAREDYRHFTINNKREFFQIEDAPETYFASFSGRFSEDIGAGIGLFQRNFGVFTTFGGIVNFAYNTRLSSESNLTFGLNLLAYSSSINMDRVVTTVTDPFINNLPSSLITTISPGINYGSGFIDVGLTINNLVSYDVSTSQILQEQTQRGIQGHLMYSGYIDSYGFFNNSKFSALVRAEFQEETSIYSGTVMLRVPKGFWIQGGYNTLYGASAGAGFNITSKIALEYSYEKSLGNFLDLGSSHELTLAYILPTQNASSFRQEKITGLLNFEKKRKSSYSRRSRLARNKTKEPVKPTESSSEQQIEEEEQTTSIAEKARIEAEEQARLVAVEQARLEAEEQARLEAEAIAKRAAEEQVRLDTAEQARLEAEEQARLEAEAIAKRAAEEQARLAAAEQARLEADEQARLEAEAIAKKAVEVEKQDGEEKIDIPTPNDQLGRSIQTLTAQAEALQNSQTTLLESLTIAVNSKDKDLKALKNENDLSEQGIFVEPRPFKSVSQENANIESLKLELDKTLEKQNKKIEELEDAYTKRAKKVRGNDKVNQYFRDAIISLKKQREETRNAKISTISLLESIKVATQFERSRRIKRAAFDDEDDRYKEDQAALAILKQNTPLSSVPYKVEDFDFGEKRSNNIQILKNVENVDNAYYIILAVHGNTIKRDEFVKKVIASGYPNVNFFYDINTSKYYIYSDKTTSLQSANEKLGNQNNAPYTSRISIIKIEN